MCYGTHFSEKYGELMNISFMLTTQQIINKTKHVTRRMGWRKLKAGQLLNACEKCQGLKKGEKVTHLGQIRVTSVHTEPLKAITQAEVNREGFPDMTPDQFIQFFCQSHKGCTPETIVTVINFDHTV